MAEDFWSSGQRTGVKKADDRGQQSGEQWLLGQMTEDQQGSVHGSAEWRTRVARTEDS